MSSQPEWIDFYLGRPGVAGQQPLYQGSALAGAPPAIHPLEDMVDRGLLEPPDPVSESAWCVQLMETWSLHAWPHQYDTSESTPWAACYASRSLYLYRWGRLYLVAHLTRWAGAPETEPAPFPSMKGPP